MHGRQSCKEYPNVRLICPVVVRANKDGLELLNGQDTNRANNRTCTWFICLVAVRATKCCLGARTEPHSCVKNFMTFHRIILLLITF